MSYAPPAVTSAGLTIPSYQDIRDSLVATYKAIYGASVYLPNDAADYQWISALALMLADEASALQVAYNQMAPQTATGAGLDALVKLNGLKRKLASASSCQVTVSGTAGTIITNGTTERDTPTV